MKSPVFLLFFLVIAAQITATESTCFGTTKKGRLENGIRLPGNGKNFTSYSLIAEIAGRTYVHSKVYETVLDAYRMLEDSRPSKIYKYAETGFKNGGKFSPHKTHQNGLSVDFMVPVLNEKNISVHLPTHLFNKLGYNIEFDSVGKYEDYRIDYEAMAAHIKALHIAARKSGIGIRRVIFDPKLQKYLFKTEYGGYLKQNILFSRKRSWVRHDEHYHVDFETSCKPMTNQPISK